MSGIHAADGGIAEGSVAVNGAALQTLSSFEGETPPYAFDEFQRRGAKRVARGRLARQGVAASFAVVGVAMLAAIVALLRPLDSGAVAMDSAIPGASVDAALADEPALVNVDQFALRESLADDIAWLDQQLNEGLAYAMPEEELAQLAATRELLASSLQSVTYAHALMTY